MTRNYLKKRQEEKDIHLMAVFQKNQGYLVHPCFLSPLTAHTFITLDNLILHKGFYMSLSPNQQCQSTQKNTNH